MKHSRRKEESDSDEEIFAYKSLKRFKRVDGENPSLKRTGSFNIAQASKAKGKASRKAQPHSQKSGKRKHKGIRPSTGQLSQTTKTRIVSDDDDIIECTPATETQRLAEGLGLGNGHVKCATPATSPALHDLNSMPEGYCPFCQMPLRVLKLVTPDLHTMECMDLPIIATAECPDGMNCVSTVIAHYREFKHSMLAKIRANAPLGSPDAVGGLVNEKRASMSGGKNAWRRLDFGASDQLDVTEEVNNQDDVTVIDVDTTNLCLSMKSDLTENYSEDVHDMGSGVEKGSSSKIDLCENNEQMDNPSDAIPSEEENDITKERMVSGSDTSVMVTKGRSPVSSGTTSPMSSPYFKSVNSMKSPGKHFKFHRTLTSSPGCAESKSITEGESCDDGCARVTQNDKYGHRESKTVTEDVNCNESGRGTWGSLCTQKSKMCTQGDKCAKESGAIKELDSTSKMKEHASTSCDIVRSCETEGSTELAASPAHSVCSIQCAQHSEMETENNVDREIESDEDIFSLQDLSASQIDSGGVDILKKDLEVSDLLELALDDGDNDKIAPKPPSESDKAADDDTDVDYVDKDGGEKTEDGHPDRKDDLNEQFEDDDDNDLIIIAEIIEKGSYQTNKTPEAKSGGIKFIGSQFNKITPSKGATHTPQKGKGGTNTPSKCSTHTPRKGKRTPFKHTKVRTPRKKVSGKNTGSEGSIKQTSILSFFGSKSEKGQVGVKGKSEMSLASTSSSSTEVEVIDSCATVKSETSTKHESKPWSLKYSRTSKAGGKAGTNWLDREVTVRSPRPVRGFISVEPPGEKQGSYSAKGSKRPCPFYKRIPGTPFTVDAFKFGVIPGCKAYFLTHFHYDHYQGLSKKFLQALYCSKVTANLVEKRIRVQPRYIHVLPMNKPQVVEDVEVTLLDANHCPGSVLILFKLRNGTTILHTGDFRADRSMEDYPQLQGVKIKELYLDTTYCDPAYAFPPQQDVINFAVNIATDAVHENPNTLVVCGTYTIGKERIFMAIAEALNSRVCVTREKKGILDCLEDPRLQKQLTLKMTDAKVHVLPMGKLNYTSLSEYVGKLKPRFDQVLAFEPTGWTHSKKGVNLENIRPKFRRENITVYGVPYSEHSSYTEMKRFVQFIRPDKILPTVNNGNPVSRKRMEALFSQWQAEDIDSPKKFVRQTTLHDLFKS